MIHLSSVSVFCWEGARLSFPGFVGIAGKRGFYYFYFKFNVFPCEYGYPARILFN